MKRREFITLLAGAAVWPLGTDAQQSKDQAPSSVTRNLRLQAEAIAQKIGIFIKEIEDQIRTTATLPWEANKQLLIEKRRFAGLQLLRRVPAITELAQLDPSGKEQLRVSRLTMDVVGSRTDYGTDPRFAQAIANGRYYGPVNFHEVGAIERRLVLPLMQLSVAGTLPDTGVNVAEVSLAPIQDLIGSTKIGTQGTAYVVDVQDRVIAHSDVGLVQRDFSNLPHVQAARLGTVTEPGQVILDINGREVLAVYASVVPLDWRVFLESPVSEADTPPPN